MDISYRQLKAFTILVEKNNMTTAAEVCHMTQSALSQSMKRLSTQLNCTLFTRKENKLELTEVGQALYLEAKELTKRLEFFQAKYSKSYFTVSSLYSLAASIVPMVFYQLQLKNHRYELILLERKMDEILLSVLNGSADIGVSIDPHCSEVEFLPLFDDYMCFICPSSHRFAKRKSVTWLEIYEEINISVESKNSIRDIIDEIYLRLNLSYKPSININRAETIIGMVQNKLGCSVLSSIFAFLKRNEDICFIPIDSPKIFRKIGLIKRKDYHHPMVIPFYNKSIEVLENWAATKEHYIGPNGSPIE